MDKKGQDYENTVFTGCATAMVTPYAESGIDYKTMAALIDRQIENGVSALVISGTTGEAATLTPEERRERHGARAALRPRRGSCRRGRGTALHAIL